MHLTLGTARRGVRTFQAVFYAVALFWLDGFAVPAPAQVTHEEESQIINQKALKLFNENLLFKKTI